MNISEIIPLSLPVLLMLAFGYGAIIGSFLNVYIYRFNTGKSLQGRSHCLSCGKTLRAFELVPLLSYAALRGKCRSCGSHIPSRYFVVELCTAILFCLAVLTAQSIAELLYLWAALSLVIVITVYDIRHYIIPDILTGTLLVLSFGWLGFQVYQGLSFYDVLHTVMAAGAAVAFLFSLWFISKGRWIGFGDVKLVFPLALMVGAAHVFSMVVLSFWIGAAVSLLLVFAAKIQRGKLRLRFLPSNLTIKSVVPFAPFLVAGCLAVLFTHLNVLNIFTL